MQASTLMMNHEMDPAINDLILGIITETALWKSSSTSEENSILLMQSTIQILIDLAAKAKHETAKDGGVIDINIDVDIDIGKTENDSNAAASSHFHFQLAQSSIIAAGTLRALLYHYGPAKGKGRKALLSAISSLGGHPSEPKIFATTVLIAALSTGTKEDATTDDASPNANTNTSANANDGKTNASATDEDHRAASRAAVSGILPGGRYQYKNRKNNINFKNEKSAMEEEIIQNPGISCTSQFGVIAATSLLQSAASSSSTTATVITPATATAITIDLHIVTTFVRAFISDTSPLMGECSKVVRQILHLEPKDDDAFDENTPRPQIAKLDAAGAFGLASIIGPWTEISPRLLVDVAISMSLWDAAERICISAIQKRSQFGSSSSAVEVNVNVNVNVDADADEAVHALIDGSSERHMYRQSDSYATEFYDNGGRSRYAEARFMHACDTISKVLAKRQYPIIERQVERVDRAFKKIKDDKDHDNATNQDDPLRDGPQDIREYVLSRLGQCNEHDAAHRLAKLWDMEYWYDEEDAEKYAMARKEQYLQWEHIFPGADIPDVLAHPTELKTAFAELLTSRDKAVGACIGFDVEWGDTCDGAGLLQLSTEKMAILIDVPALISSDEGCEALEFTVGNLFAGNYVSSDDNASTNDIAQKVLVVGFSCREDLSRLSASSREAQKPWFTKTEAFVDIKPLIAKHKPQLKHLGLSRISEYYLGKPLDKAEQCSLWDRRPLTESQRVYSSLDAWAVAALWSSIHGHQNHERMKEN